MQVNCKVNVVNRLLPLTGQSAPSRLVWSNVTLSENSANKSVELSLANARNKTGAKYRVTDNIEQVFSKFIGEGKLTLRFKQPPHDLCFSGKPEQVAKILSIIRGKDDQLKKGTLCPLLLNKVVVPKTKLNITSRADYPVTTTFPETLTTLKVLKYFCLFLGSCYKSFPWQINGIALKKLDRRILRLQVLEILDLSDNQISTLPEDISPLKKLKQLNLSKNEIRFLPRSFLNSLRAANLDISHNQVIRFCWKHCGSHVIYCFLQIAALPSCISRVTGLQVLKVDHNLISSLPQTISKLSTLRLSN